MGQEAFTGNEPFPAHVQVAVLNKNDFEIELMWDSKVYNFVPGKPLMVPAEVAFALFSYDTRPGHENVRDKLFGRTSTHGGHYETRLINMGWANNPEMRKAFDNFEFTPLNQSGQMTLAEFERLKKQYPGS
jgi:hypothetical protein